MLTNAAPEQLGFCLELNTDMFDNITSMNVLWIRNCIAYSEPVKSPALGMLPPITRKPEHQRFTANSSILSSISSR